MEENTYLAYSNGMESASKAPMTDSDYEPSSSLTFGGGRRSVRPLQFSDSERERVLARALPPRRHAALLLVPLLGAVAFATWLGASRWPLTAGLRGLAGRSEEKGRRVEPEEPSFCGEIHDDLEFHTRKSLYWVRNIGSKELCCAECDGEPECGAWTYGKQQGVDGLSNHCYLKKLGDGEEPQRVKRTGVVSGLLRHRLAKHGVVADMLAEKVRNGSLDERGIFANETCPGKLNVTGQGMMSIVSAQWYTPKERATIVDVPDADWAVMPHLQSRAYFASNCTPGKYNHSEYAAIKLLGGSIRYTTDLSGVGCGCNAQFHLVPMRQKSSAGACHDHFCGHSHSSCNASCAEIGLQDANQYAWSSSLHLHDDEGGENAGYGGGDSWIGRRDWSDSQYGPGAKCVDTTWPFQVEVSFPVDDDGVLEAMEVTLSQAGHDCPLKARIDEYAFMGRDGLAELSRVLDAGVTPTISYWGSHDMQWMDGVGIDGKGPCVKDAPRACPATVRFYDIAVESRASERTPASGEQSGSSLLNVAISNLHENAEKRAEQQRKEELAKIIAGKHLPEMRGCGEECDTTAADMLNLTKGHDGGEGEEADEHKEDYAEEDRGNSEWLVVVPRVHVRAEADHSAKVLGDVVAGEVVIGKEVSDWIRIAHEHGYVPISEGKHVVLKERTVSYEKIVHGSCEDVGMFPITGLRTCEAAAFALGYFDTSVKTYAGKDERPEGCFLLKGQVWLAPGKAHSGNGAVGGGEPICSSTAYATTTSTTTTETSTTTITTTTTTSTTITTTSTTTWGWPSLFCVEVVRTKGYELPLVKEQQKHRASIFSCDEYVVFSDGGEPRTVGIGPDGKKIRTIVIPPIKESIGDLNAGATTNSWLNTETFLQVWDLAKKDGRFMHHDWTVKVDPDAVFFPDRLREHLKPHTASAAPLYVMNCNRYNPVALYGSVEIFSKAALDKYLHGQMNCRNNLPWHGWGEDFFMSHCMDMLGVGRIYEFALLSDKRCFYSPCSDTSKVVYHDYKDASPDGSWFQCYRQSLSR